MSRYVDADALKANCDIMVGNTTIGRRDYVMFHEIDSAPSIEIIRCRECKYWQPHEQYGYDEDNDEYHDYCGLLVPEDEYYAFRRKAYDFCSYGEREGE